MHLFLSCSDAVGYVKLINNNNNNNNNNNIRDVLILNFTDIPITSIS